MHSSSGMKPLPDPETLAKLVSNVTTTMLGIAFRPVVGDPTPPQDREWKTALLAIPGGRPITIGLASDLESGHQLCAAMFQCPSRDVDAAMMEDSLRELTNMTAGLVKNVLSLDQSLGLPKILPGSAMPSRGAPPHTQSVMLQADRLGLLLWVSEGAHG